MGMFDELRSEFKLPGVIDSAQTLVFQTKSLDEVMDNFLLKEDGTLWHEEYEARVEKTKRAPLGFFIHRENARWVQRSHCGELRFNHYSSEADHLEFLAFLMNGRLREIHLIKATPNWRVAGMQQNEAG